MVRRERLEARELDDGTELVFEEHGQHDEVEWGCFTETRADLDVIARDLGEQDRLPFDRGLTDDAFAEPEAVRDVLAFAVRIRREELERLSVGVVDHEESAVTRL